jgi:membrane protease YdiL (CAAX protease family)
LTSIAVTIAAGLMFGAAYFVTRRLWLPIGIHFSWNFISDTVFSLPTSGLTAKGLLQGRLSGPEWLSGGTYGIEASLVTLVVISVATVWLLIVVKRRAQTTSRRSPT